MYGKFYERTNRIKNVALLENGMKIPYDQCILLGEEEYDCDFDKERLEFLGFGTIYSVNGVTQIGNDKRRYAFLKQKFQGVSDECYEYEGSHQFAGSSIKQEMFGDDPTLFKYDQEVFKAYCDKIRQSFQDIDDTKLAFVKKFIEEYKIKKASKQEEEEKE